MHEQISLRELRDDGARIMRAVGAGTTFVVTSNGQPVAELRPLRRHTFVEKAAVLGMFRDAPAIDWTRMREDLDQTADEDEAPRA